MAVGWLKAGTEDTSTMARPVVLGMKCPVFFEFLFLRILLAFDLAGNYLAYSKPPNHHT